MTSNVNVPSRGERTVTERLGWKITVENPSIAEAPVECLDLSTFDYHSFSTHPQVVDVARKTVSAYGVGSCGPRGFYGTIKPHLDAEKDIMEFLKTEDAVIYSFSHATVGTLVSCFAGRQDYILMDGGCSRAVYEGCLLSRANLTPYDHNNMADLEEKMKGVAEKDGKRAPHRRVVVTEGLFYGDGSICNLPKIKELCDKYKFRLLLEDSYGFGALGKSSRGTPDHFGIPVSAIDVYVGSLSNSLGAVGGFCAGSSAMVDFQRLGSHAYVFSASLAPYVTAAVSSVLSILDKDFSFSENLQKRSTVFRKSLREAMPKMKHVELLGTDASPIVVLRAEAGYRKNLGDDAVEEKFQKVVNMVEKEKILIYRHTFNRADANFNEPSIRIIVKSQIPEADLKAAAAAIAHAITTEFS